MNVIEFWTYVTNDILEPTTLATTSLSTTSFSTIPSTINNTEGSTGNFSGTESTPSGEQFKFCINDQLWYASFIMTRDITLYSNIEI